MPTLLPQTTAAIRSRIETAALELFTSRGYAATTTRQIARAAGLSAGAIYTHYAGKEELFAAVAARCQDRLLSGENPVVAALQSSSFPHDLPRLARAIQALVREHRAYWLLWYVDVIEFRGRHFQAMLAPELLMRRPEVQARFEALRRSGALRVPPETAFRMIVMQFFNYFLVETLFGGQEHYGLTEDAAVGAIVDTFLHGVLKEVRK